MESPSISCSYATTRSSTNESNAYARLACSIYNDFSHLNLSDANVDAVVKADAVHLVAATIRDRNRMAAIKKETARLEKECAAMILAFEDHPSTKIKAGQVGGRPTSHGTLDALVATMATARSILASGMMKGTEKEKIRFAAGVRVATVEAKKMERDGGDEMLGVLSEEEFEVDETCTS